MAETGNGETRFDLSGSGAVPLEAEDPRVIGGIPLLGRLGSGGMGRVYLGVFEGRYAAVKQVLPAFAEDQDFLRHFGHELDNLGRLPAEVSAPLLASERAGRPPWFATAYIPGLTLSQVIELHGGSLSVPVLWLLLRETAAGLKAVHALDMVHRDLKPSNVMLTEEGVTLIDFGVARAADQSRLTRTGMMLGTPAYMSPEQANGSKHFTGATDVWALGALIAYAASGEPPFGEGSGVDLLYRIVHTEPDLERLRALDAELAEVVAACLDKNPLARPSADRLHQLGRQKCGAPQPGWPQAVMQALERRSAFARLEAPEIPLPAVAEVPQAAEVAGQVGDTTFVRMGGSAERPRRRSRLLFVMLPVVLATGATVAVELVPGVSSPSASAGGSPSASASALTSAPVGALPPTASAGASTSATARPSLTPTASPSTGGTGAGPGTNGHAAGGSSGTTHGASEGASAGNGGGSGSGGSGSGGSGSGSQTHPPSGSAPGTVTAWSAYFQGYCFGSCQYPLLVKWTQVAGATSYQIHYTNDGKGNPNDKTDTVISAGDASSRTISSQMSGDDICLWLRAVNSHGVSPWSQSICSATPY
ncbi:serine/threonine-protein kinase [Streptacidiphilus melanogenes]|uniref:serine/threonine-protein kinase n=1 Tax=Streptacidiphilus melanogenes TaxID=411235 RepID=UPI00069404D3|nr:serine/threonine-protein kinase [Streptacidiphilus melanogenes]